MTVRIRRIITATPSVFAVLTLVVSTVFPAHTVLAASPGAVVAWGDNGASQTNVPTGLDNVIAVAGARYASVALKSDGTVRAWGDTAPFTSPAVTLVPAGLTGVTAISANGTNAMALKSDGSVVRWQAQWCSCVSSPPDVLTGVHAIAAGAAFELVAFNDGTVGAWGDNFVGELNVPPALSGVIAVSAGDNHALALRSDGTVVAWGNNNAGQTTVPPGLSGVVAISARGNHSLALKSDGTVVAWGDNTYGESSVPAGLSGVVSMAAGSQNSVALKSDGTIVMWGNTFNGLNVVPPGLKPVTAIASGDFFTLAIVASDTTPPTTIASLSGQQGNNGWYVGPLSVSLTATDNAGGSGVASTVYSIDDGPTQTYTSPFTIQSDGKHSMSFHSTDVAGNVEANETTPLQIDTTPPTIKCASPDGQWHATDVSLACTATDAGSGLANSADASFSVSTSVPPGTETSTASTGAHSVTDAAGNTATAAPIGGNMVDKKAPAITLSVPSASTYPLKQAVTASYTCSDGGSGVATCAGPVPNAGSIDTSSVGTKTFAVNATDNVGNAATPQTVTYQVAYALPAACVLYDQTKAVQSGSVIAIKFQLCDANAVDVSDAAITVTAQGLTQISTQAPGNLESVGAANPDNNFRFDSTLGPTGGYIYNLSTRGLSTGTYVMTFAATGDVTVHQVQFQVR